MSIRHHRLTTAFGAASLPSKVGRYTTAVLGSVLVLAAAACGRVGYGSHQVTDGGDPLDGNDSDTGFGSDPAVDSGLPASDGGAVDADSSVLDSSLADSSLVDSSVSLDGGGDAASDTGAPGTCDGASCTCPAGEVCMGTCTTPDCVIVCEAGSTCAYVCTADSCTLDCPLGADCDLTCAPASCMPGCASGGCSPGGGQRAVCTLNTCMTETPDGGL